MCACRVIDEMITGVLPPERSTPHSG